MAYSRFAHQNQSTIHDILFITPSNGKFVFYLDQPSPQSQRLHLTNTTKLPVAIRIQAINANNTYGDVLVQGLLESFNQAIIPVYPSAVNIDQSRVCETFVIIAAVVAPVFACGTAINLPEIMFQHAAAGGKFYEHALHCVYEKRVPHSEKLALFALIGFQRRQPVKPQEVHRVRAASRKRRPPQSSTHLKAFARLSLLENIPEESASRLISSTVPKINFAKMPLHFDCSRFLDALNLMRCPCSAYRALAEDRTASSELLDIESANVASGQQVHLQQPTGPPTMSVANGMERSDSAGGHHQQANIFFTNDEGLAGSTTSQVVVPHRNGHHTGATTETNTFDFNAKPTARVSAAVPQSLDFSNSRKLTIDYPAVMDPLALQEYYWRQNLARIRESVRNLDEIVIQQEMTFNNLTAMDLDTGVLSSAEINVIVREIRQNPSLAEVLNSFSDETTDDISSDLTEVTDLDEVEDEDIGDTIGTDQSGSAEGEQTDNDSKELDTNSEQVLFEDEPNYPLMNKIVPLIIIVVFVPIIISAFGRMQTQ